MTSDELSHWNSLTPEQKRMQLSLRESLHKWQTLLGMRDWDVRIEWTRDPAIVADGAKADCNYSRYSKQAVIRILDPELYDGHGIWEQDPDQSVLHELLHVLLADLVERKPTGDPHEDSIPEERTVVQLTRIIHSCYIGERALHDIIEGLRKENQQLKNQLGITE